MSLENLEIIIHWLVGLYALTTLGIILYGINRGTRHRAGRTTGLAGPYLRSAWFYLLSTVLFVGISYLGWIPLPLFLSDQVRAWMLAVGSLLYFPGMSFTLWGRLTLGENYFVSTGFGAQLFADQQLVTVGPYAIVRHPMYSGIILAALGSLLIYFTWTTLVFCCFAPFMTIRARREEAILAEEFGEQWKEYCKRVPAFFPQLRTSG